MNMKKLELYYFPACPYCYIVLQKIEELSLNITLKDIHEDQNAREYLYNITGRYTVPGLFINDKPIHESLLIIKWLEENFDN